jgi:formylglycine-generating enzyme required for sulfatase activity
VASWAAVLGLVVLATAAWLSRPYFRLWWHFEPLGRNDQGYAEYRHRKTGIVFVFLPGGKFLMGAQKDDPGAPNYDPEAKANEGPVHGVELRPFLVAKYEVTQAEWERVMGKNPSCFKGDDFPVEQVSWNNCQDFCRKTGLKLPTEAQWEYSCRVGSTGLRSGTGRLEDIAWFEGNSGGRTHPVGQKQPNRFGLHDMYGNAAEWCEDIWDEAFYSRPEAAGLDPVCTSDSRGRVLRGGAIYHHLVDARCACRGWDSSTLSVRNFGFRVVASPFSSDR